MSQKILDLFDEVDKHTAEPKRSEILHAPFSWPGGKTRSVECILKYLPYRKIYVEPFGGSATVLLARNASDLEVFNDRHAGVTQFYRCMRNKDMMERFCNLIQLMPHSREEFDFTRANWDIVNDEVLRAVYWYFLTVTSFSSIGRHWGRSINGNNQMISKILNKLPLFPKIYERMQHVQIENMDWEQLCTDYDNSEAVFYMDPPYLGAQEGNYKYNFTREDHYRFLSKVFTMKAFVAVSGFPDELYEQQPWDLRHEWEVFHSSKGMAFQEANGKAELANVTEREHKKEVLWIKEARY